MLMFFILSLLHTSSALNLSEVNTTLTSVQVGIVNIHNAFRKAVTPTASNMLKMTWSNSAAQSAQGWISQCKMTRGPPSSRTVDGYELGENTYWSSMVSSWTHVVTAWHNQVKNYHYPTGSTNGEATGCYTQIVWYSSYEVGCAVAQCGSSYFYGCHYFRAGNIGGLPPYSLGTPCAACPNNCEDGLCTNPCPYINQFSNCDQLKKKLTCNDNSVKIWCPASCQCKTEIIPAARK